MTSIPPPVAKGWYPDPETGGTRYWEGTRWTGDVRPRRRAFAPECSTSPLGGISIALGVLWVPLSLGAYSETHSGGYIVSAILVLLAGLVGGIYLLRGRGPSTAEVEARLAAERKEAQKKRRSANLWGLAAGLTRAVSRPGPPAPPAEPGTVAAAQINAIADPETARSLQSLQNLLYTRTITDAEYQAAKDKLLGGTETADPYAQIAKLTELHEAGVLGDIEYAAAKARVLGL